MSESGSRSYIEFEIVVMNEGDAEQIAVPLREDRPESVQIAHTAGLDGDLAQWRVLGESSLTALSKLITVVLSLVDRRRVRSITVDGIQIENPSDEDVQKLLERAGVRDGRAS